MPIHIRNLAVSLVSQGEEFQYYQQEEVDETTTTCFVPSEAGKEFSVRYDDRGHGINDFTWTVFVDGRKIQGLDTHKRDTGEIEGHLLSSTQVRPFRFSELELTEEPQALPLGVDINKLGCVEVTAHRIEYLEQPRSEDRTYYTKAIPESIGPVPEKAKKVGWHTVSLGEARAAEETFVLGGKIKYLDALEEPYAKFCFRYRPPALLQAQGIMPPPPPSQRSPSPEQEDPAKFARIRALQDSIKAAEAARRAAEAERRAAEAELANLGIKREGSPILLSEGGNEVIDLTLDDD